MNGRERFLATIKGRMSPLAAGVAYPEIPFRDRCEEHMQHPWWILNEMDAAKMIPAVRHYLETIGCDWWQVLWTPPREEREQMQYFRASGRDFILNKLTGEKRELFHPARALPALTSTLSGPKPILSDDEYLERIRFVTAETQIQTGQWDFAKATMNALGQDYFIYSYTSTPFVLSFVKGFTETLMDILVNPSFLHMMGDRLVAQQKEFFRAMAMAGIHGVWMQDWNGGKEVLSREQYQDMVVPHARELVAEAHRQGLMVIHYFMGNPIDRADLVASVGAEVILFEEARKGYEINLEALAGQIHDDQVVMGNLSAEDVLARGSESDLRAEIESLISLGRKRGRFMMATGSPPTPETPLDRIQFALATARRLWEQ